MTADGGLYSTGFGIRADRIVITKLEELHANPRYQNKGYFNETDITGGGFYIKRGGFWNDTENRASSGVTKSDVREVRSAMRRLGISVSFEDVDAILCEAYARTDGGSRDTLYAMEEVLDGAKNRRRRARERAIEKGDCIMCCAAPAKPGENPRTKRPYTTCEACVRKANARKKKASASK